MLELKFFVEGEERSVSLSGGEVRFGRSADNEIVLPDYSVSRRHATMRMETGVYVIVDLQSTNGVQLNGQNVQRAQVKAGDHLKIGVFELRVANPELPSPPADGVRIGQTTPSRPMTSSELGAAPFAVDSAAPARVPTAASTSMPAAPPPLPLPAQSPPQIQSMATDAAISNATIVRSLEELSAELGLDNKVRSRDASAIRVKRQALDEAYASHVFGFLTRLARMMIATESDDEILTHVLDIAFEIFPVDRGFILLRDEETSELTCELMREGDKVELRPESEAPISKTMLESVMRERVALLTYDALSDQRLAGTESVRIHQIRAAMCAPLWSGEKIIGVMQFDTPHHTGTFTEPDVDLLATLANYCAVALERNRNARDAEFQREVRNRLSRYHSPAVIEQVMKEGLPPVEGASPEGKLKKAEVSVLFADIVGFTAYSEMAAPEEVAELMDGYFTHAVEAIFKHGGTLDKFIGDCVMAFFGAPMQQPDHAYRAVAAAVEIRAALRKWNDERVAEGLPSVKIRIAINTGPVVVGDIGSSRRVDYTVLGNTVNVAARLEEMVASPGDIVLGSATFEQLEGRIPTRALGEFQLKGLSQKITAHQVI